MTRELLYPSLVTILSLFVYMVFTGFVGRARSRYNVPAPQTTGNDNFERVLRVQQNTAEQMLSFLPALWIFALVISPMWSAAIGGVWIIGRIVYAAGYFKAAAKRGTGFAITAAANVTLLVGSLVGIIMALTRAT